MCRTLLRFAFRTAPFALALLAACQPQARRLLLLDERLTDPAGLGATARPWHEAGYTVEYRRYYPHLTRADLARYRTVVLLGGTAPDVPSDAITVGDVAILTEWLLRGGVVVLGYPDGRSGGGGLDRWTMNQWLAWSGAGITILEAGLHDSAGGSPPALAVQETDVREVGFEPFSAGDYNSLQVAMRAQVLARASGERGAQRDAHAPVVAARRAGDGLILVLSRSTLGALAGAEQVTAPASAAEYRETRTFLEALARWTRRPAEWARIPPAATRAPLVLGGVTGEPDRAVHVPPRFPPLGAPPRGVALSVLTGAAVPDSTRGGTRAAELPGWAARAGLRALAGNLPALDHRAPAATRAALLDSLADLLEAGAFNLILTNARATALVDSSHWSRWDRDATRATWEQIADRLDATSVRWIPLVAVQDYAADSGYGCPLDPRLWENVLTPAVRALVRLAAAHTDVIPAIGIDLTGTGWARTSYCDVAWQKGLADLASDSGFSRDRIARLTTLPQTERYDSLSVAGLLPRYEGGLERAVTRRATALRAEARRSRPDLLFGVVTDQVPADWVTRGLVAGLSGPEAPVMVFGPDDGLSHSIPQALRVVRLDPGRFAHIDTSLAHRVFREREGFWLAPAELLLGRAAPDLIHQLRRFAKDR